MKKRLRLFQRLPAWLAVVIVIVLVAGIGFIDYLTGDYSILIFYAIPVGLAAWALGDWGGISVAAGSGLARYLSDLNSYANGRIRYWNSLEDMLFLIIFGLLVSSVQRMLDEEEEGRKDD